MIADFGLVDGHPVQAVTLRAGAMTAKLITWGARLTELHVPDRNGVTADVVLGFDSLAGYLATDHYFGATCGRYGNRIAGGTFDLEGQTVQLDCNEGPNHLHGGSTGFDRKHWAIAAQGADHVTFAALSEDGEMGFPGRCALQTEYRLTDTTLTITMTADTTRTTVMNMVNHSYFNLAGQGSGTILAHDLQVNAAFYTPVNTALLATGEVRAVANTPFDFRTPKPVGRDIATLTGGYDHNWCLGPAGAELLRDCATLTDPASGRRMTLRTTEPGVQIYTCGSVKDTAAAKAGHPISKFGGLTFETQKFPGTPNHPHFPTATLHPGDTYHHVMALEFSAPANP